MSKYRHERRFLQQQGNGLIVHEIENIFFFNVL